MLKIGDKAPDFKFTGPKREEVRLKDFKGKKVVLYFYPKDDTPGCTKEACSFENKLGVIKKKGAVILGVSADSTASHEKFAEKNGLSFPLISDEDKSIIKSYGVWKQKSMYGRKYLGIERTTFIIDEKGRLKNIYRKVKVNGHSEEVLAAL
jgi:thioredoxin-dependent peroxiredoxin